MRSVPVLRDAWLIPLEKISTGRHLEFKLASYVDEPRSCLRPPPTAKGRIVTQKIHNGFLRPAPASFELLTITTGCSMLLIKNPKQNYTKCVSCVFIKSRHLIQYKLLTHSYDHQFTLFNLRFR